MADSVYVTSLLKPTFGDKAAAVREDVMAGVGGTATAKKLESELRKRILAFLFDESGCFGSPVSVHE
jgi:hypothetical protein